MNPYHSSQDGRTQDSGDWRPSYPPLDLPAGQAPFGRHAVSSSSFEQSSHQQDASQNTSFSQQHDQNHSELQYPQPHQQHSDHQLHFADALSDSPSQHPAQSRLGGPLFQGYASISTISPGYHTPAASYPSDTSIGYDVSSTQGFQPRFRDPSNSQYTSGSSSHHISPPQLGTSMGPSLRNQQISDLIERQRPAPQRRDSGGARLTTTPSEMGRSAYSMSSGGMGFQGSLSSMGTSGPPRRSHGQAPYAPSNTGLNAHARSFDDSYPTQYQLGSGGGDHSSSPYSDVPRHIAQHDNLGSQRFPLSLAGSLDPATGIFYRSPEHPRLRTAQACEKCRTRKAKCSGEHPACKRCITRGLVCEYAKESRVRGPNKTKSQLQDSGPSSSQQQQAKNGVGSAAGASNSGTEDSQSGSAGGIPESTDADVEMSTEEGLYHEEYSQQKVSPGGGAGRGEMSVPPSRRRHAAAAAAAANSQGFPGQRQQDSSTPSSQGSAPGSAGEHRVALSSYRNPSQFQVGGQTQPIALGMGLSTSSIPAPVPVSFQSPAAFGLGPATGMMSNLNAASSNSSPSPYSYGFASADVGIPVSTSASSSSVVPSSLSSITSNVSPASSSFVTIAQRRGVSPHSHSLGLGQRFGLRGSSDLRTMHHAPQTRLAAHIPISSAYPYSIPSRTVSHAPADDFVQGGATHGNNSMGSAYMHSTQEQTFQPVYDAQGTYQQLSQYGLPHETLADPEHPSNGSGHQQQDAPGDQYQNEPQPVQESQGQYTVDFAGNFTHPYAAVDDGSRTTRIPQDPRHSIPDTQQNPKSITTSSHDGQDDRHLQSASTNAPLYTAHSYAPHPVNLLSSTPVDYSRDTSVSPIPEHAEHSYSVSSLTTTPSTSRIMIPTGESGPQQGMLPPAPINVDDRQQHATDAVNEQNPSMVPAGAREEYPRPLDLHPPPTAQIMAMNAPNSLHDVDASSVEETSQRASAEGGVPIQNSSGGDSVASVVDTNMYA